MGSVELSGRVRLETPIVDPIFKRACGYFRVVVEEQRGSGKNRHWVTVYQNDSSLTPFLIEDSTGIARVSPLKAELQFPPEVKTSSVSVLGRLGNDPVTAFLKSVGTSWGSCRITAHILREGQPLFLVGFALPAESAAQAPRPLARDAARTLKNDPLEMKKLDANKDGVVDSHEWDAGVARKTRELNAQEDALTGEVPVDSMVTVRCSPDGTFVLADSEESLLSKLDLVAWLSIIGGPIVVIASSAYLFIRFGQ